MSSSDLLATGSSCSHEACRTIDFLPFKCRHCTQSYCGEHWKPEQHECKKYDPKAEDRIVPQCPLCSKPVNIPSGQDPNVAMDRHLNNDCSVISGKRNKGPVCGNKKCGKSLITPIVCQTCKGQFCPTHRFPSSHTCVPSPTIQSPSGVTAAAGLAAFKRATADVSESISTTVKRSGGIPSPFTAGAKLGGNKNTGIPSGSSKGGLLKEIKTDRRTTAEEKSRQKALQAKAKKGLISEQELAQLKKQEAEGKKKDDCIIM